MDETTHTIMAFMVPDPDEWWHNAVEVLGEETAQEALKAKVERHRPVYEAAAVAGKVKTRAQRDAEEEAERAAQVEAGKDEALIWQKMREMAIRELQAEGKLTKND